MELRRLQRTAFAAWLGLLALGVQFLLPILVSFEVTLAAESGNDSIFSLCVYGHLHEAAPHEHSGKTDEPSHKGLADACPLCIALHAQGAFTAPAIAALPLPSLDGSAVPRTTVRAALHVPPTAVYRSRAPPLV